jgi:hypothetical protein
MNTPQQFDIDQLIDKQHSDAQRTEDDALRVIARLHKIPGIEAWLSSAQKRRLTGEMPNPWAAVNLSAQALIQRDDPALATFLAGRAGQATSAPDYARQEDERKRAENLHRMETATAEMKARRMVKNQQLNRQLSHGVWSPAHARVI